MSLCNKAAVTQKTLLTVDAVWLYFNERAWIGDRDSQWRMIVSHDYERRSGKDRRQEDGELPGNKERRRQVESRRPEIVEVELDEAEWEMHFGRKTLVAGGADASATIEVSELFGRLSK